MAESESGVHWHRNAGVKRPEQSPRPLVGGGAGRISEIRRGVCGRFLRELEGRVHLDGW